MKRNLLLLVVAIFALGELRGSNNNQLARRSKAKNPEIINQARSESSQKRADYSNVWESLKLYGNRAGHSVANLFRSATSKAVEDLGFIEDHFYNKNFKHALGELEKRLQALVSDIEADDKARLENKTRSGKRKGGLKIDDATKTRVQQLNTIVQIVAHIINLDDWEFIPGDASKLVDTDRISNIEDAIDKLCEFNSAEFEKRKKAEMLKKVMNEIVKKEKSIQTIEKRIKSREFDEDNTEKDLKNKLQQFEKDLDRLRKQVQKLGHTQTIIEIEREE